ncbi:MAG: radical SAM protein [Anaerolineaceae bacterium]|nr:radical SAM protein [Anaerolineaceae bacterium]
MDDKTLTAAEAGYHVSDFLISAKVPDEKLFAVISLFKGSCAALRFSDILMLSAPNRLPTDSSVFQRFVKLGFLVNFDERAALEAMARGACAFPSSVGLTICPTMGCNFDCPYCFENHKSGKMSPAVQDDIAALAERMLDVSGTKTLSVTWFGGEPLLVPDVIESLSGKLIALAEKKGVKYSAEIITNGYLLDQKNADMLDRVKVDHYQITLDGIGAAHDATRHLAGGGPTFERITGNLRNVKIRGRVDIRHNVHAGNLSEIEKLRVFIAEIAKESGNDLKYYPAPVTDSPAAEKRAKQVDLLCGPDEGEIKLMQQISDLSPARGHFCGANNLWHLGIDDHGRLNKCWEDSDKPEHSFGTAAKWDPGDLLNTADHPDLLTRYLNTSGVLDDPECRECVWLPICRGGRPHKRLFQKRECLSFKSDPDAFALKVYEARKKNKNDQNA